MFESEVETQLKLMNLGKQLDLNFIKQVDNKFPLQSPKRLMMDWNEAEQLINNGFIIGSHTCNHSILASMTEQEQDLEITDSAKVLKKYLGLNFNHIAYPNGLYNCDTLRLLKKNKVKFGYTTTSGVNSFNTKKLELKRIGVNASDSIPVLLLKLLLNSFK